MTSGEVAAGDDPYVTEVPLDTGIRDQKLVVTGWFASHADTGTPGPHVHLSTNDRRNPVLKTSQIPDLVEALRVVGGHIDRMWDDKGDTWFTGDEPDDNDPAVIRQRRIDHLVFLDNLQTNFSEIAEILLRSEDMHEATAAIAPLLGVDEVEALGRLNSINLFAMTRIPSEARRKELKNLREHP
jgi:hypothetical protein